MARRYYHQDRVCPEINTHEWAAYIEGEYGVALDPQGIYADVQRRVFAGSEYVARLAAHTTCPVDATEWTASIAHFPRYGRGMQVARRRGADDPGAITGDQWGAFNAS